MIQFLINVTAIWLVSLLIFDLALRRSTHHTYNRFYLVATALLGLFAPLYPFKSAVSEAPAALTTPMAAVSEVKESIMTVASLPQNALPWTTWALAAYLLGLGLSLLALLREGLVLLRWYRQGEKEKHQSYRLVITHRDHGPFSVFGNIFISDAAAYTAEELHFILLHEGVHVRHLHFPDKALLLLVRCVFWFHPLSWLYYSRLMMVHEYEADDTAREVPRDYAEFLIQQQLAGAAPLIAHSLFHSPLKNRIRMLTAKRTRGWLKASYVLALPAIAAFAILWVNNSTAHKGVRQGNTVTFGGNRFELGQPTINGKQRPSADTIVVRAGGDASKVGDDPSALERKTDVGQVEYASKAPETIAFTFDPVPVKMNGQPIFEAEDVAVRPALSGRSQSLLSAIVKGAQDQFDKLSDGVYIYRVYSMVVDASGRVAYYTTSPVHLKAATFSVSPGADFEAAAAAAQKVKDEHPISESLQGEISAAVERTLEDLKLKPGQNDGKPVVCRVDITPGYPEVILVKNHRATVVRDTY